MQKVHTCTQKQTMHKPHPTNIVKGYAMRQVYTYLETNGYIREEGKR